MKTLRNARGFTLLEILIVLVIIAVLAGLAVPAYMSAVEKSRKQEALTNLGAVRSSEQRYFAGNNKYTSAFADLDFDPTLAVTGNVPHYTYTLPAAAAATFTARATRNATDLPAGVPANYTVEIIQTGVITSQY